MVCIYVTVTGDFEHFQCFNFVTNFLKNTNSLQKKLGYWVLVESTNIENATFSYKTALSEANIKTYRMGSTKWIHHKEWCFASNYFFENLFHFKNPLYRVDLMYQPPKCPYLHFLKVLRVLFPFHCQYP